MGATRKEHFLKVPSGEEEDSTNLIETKIILVEEIIEETFAETEGGSEDTTISIIMKIVVVTDLRLVFNIKNKIKNNFWNNF
jgi:hypothetical protein